VLHTRVIPLGPEGIGTVTVPPSRLAAVEGGSIGNRGQSFAAGDRLAGAEEFVNGPLVAHGTPDSVVTLWLHYPGV
jgi:hypothetical protein